MNLFQKATKHESKLRLALIGPSGSGKTYTALAIAKAMAEQLPDLDTARIALIDSEHGSASKYADLFRFDTAKLDSFSPLAYVNYIRAAEDAGYDIIIIDSLSHAWMGQGGVLDQVDQAAKRSSNKFAAWRDVTPRHNALVDALLRCRAHLIVTLRAKTRYAMDEVEEGGRKRTVVRKLGMEAMQRDGIEYEFDVVADLDQDNSFIVTKSRCPDLTGKVFSKAGADVAGVLLGWLAGEPVPETLEVLPVPDVLRKRFHALGTEVYGKAWDDKRHELTNSITRGRTTSSTALTEAEMRRLVEGIEQKRTAELAMVAKAQPANGAP